jgi:FkbM family methyltransferase
MNADRQSVWDRIAKERPEFLQSFDPTDNYHTVREIVLGGSLTWAEANKHFLASPGKRVMDIGANVGIFSAWCAARGAEVVAYEADPECVKILDCLGNFTVVPAAIMPYTGTVEYQGNMTPVSGIEWHNGGTFCPGMNKAAADRFEVVPCIAFDEAIGDKTWDMVKMDIEGSEAEVLLAASEQKLRQIKFMYLELHPWTPQELHDKVIERMKAVYRFDGYWSDRLNRWEALYLENKNVG